MRTDTVLVVLSDPLVLDADGVTLIQGDIPEAAKALTVEEARVMAAELLRECDLREPVPSVA